MTKGWLAIISKDGIDTVIARKETRIAMLKSLEAPEVIVSKEEKTLKMLKAYKEGK